VIVTAFGWVIWIVTAFGCVIWIVTCAIWIFLLAIEIVVLVSGKECLSEAVECVSLSLLVAREAEAVLETESHMPWFRPHPEEQQRARWLQPCHQNPCDPLRSLYSSENPPNCSRH